MIYINSCAAILNSLEHFSEPMALSLGSVIFPEEINPDLSIYYKGNKLPLDVKSKDEVKNVPYSLVESKSTQQFRILIAEQVLHASQDNTVQYLYVPEKVSYKFYTLSAARQYDKNNEVEGYCWTVVEELLLEDQIVPENTVIFLFDANYIEGLNVKNWSQNSNTRLLPDIMIKETVPYDNLTRAIIIARLAAMDLDAIHNHNITCVRKIEKQAVLSMIS